jgi:hypothetical protein
LIWDRTGQPQPLGQVLHEVPDPDQVSDVAQGVEGVPVDEATWSAAPSP